MKQVGDILEFLKKTPRYVPLQELGEGAVGKVRSVFDTYLQRVVARKELNPTHHNNPNVVQTFVNEMKLMGHLNHPGILPIYDAYLQESNDPSYVMGLAEGEDLASLLGMSTVSGDGVALPLERAVRIMEKLCETMTYAHDRGVIHLDLKPANIMIGNYGEVWIMDWGTARLHDYDKYRESLKQESDSTELIDYQHEADNLFIGTPKYMSPEQTSRRRDQLNYASDIFSVGVIFYQMLTGIHPFKGSNFEDLVDKICHWNPPGTSEINPDVPINLSRICTKMIKKDLDERYESFSEVIKDIDEYQNSAAGFPTRTFEAGEVIFREGKPSEYVCIVVTGCVGISMNIDGTHTTIARLGSNEPFGELAALTGVPRTATATALEKSVVRIIRKEDINEEVKKLSPWVGGIVQSLTTRFIDINEKLIRLEKEMSDRS